MARPKKLNSRFNEKEREQIRKLYDARNQDGSRKFSQAKIAEFLNVSQQTIGNVVNDKFNGKPKTK